MKSKLDAILDEAQKLPKGQRLRLIAALSEDIARDAAIEEAGRAFMDTKSAEDHAVEQNVMSPQRLSRSHDSGVWPDDEDLEDFLDDLRAQRQPLTDQQ